MFDNVWINFTEIASLTHAKHQNICDDTNMNKSSQISTNTKWLQIIFCFFIVLPTGRFTASNISTVSDKIYYNIYRIP